MTRLDAPAAREKRDGIAPVATARDPAPGAWRGCAAENTPVWTAMRFLVMHKNDAAMEAGTPPDKGIVDGMGALVQEGLRSGMFLNGAGLHRSAVRVRLDCKAGECAVTKGPYAGKNELVASIVMLSTRSMEQAIGHAKKLASLLGDVEIEIGPVVEPWDLGMIPKPERQVPERFLFLCKSTQRDEEDAEASKKHRAAVQELAKALGEDAAILAVETLAPSALGSRLKAGPKGKRRWVDGPYTESKELIAGFSLIELPNVSEAKAWADRYAAILDGNEVDVRLVNEAS
jgi:hypothetical protein